MEHFVSYNQEIKANYAERVIMTLKTTIRSYMQLRKTYCFIEVLQDMVYSYNNTEHRTKGMAPADVKPGYIERRLWWHLYKLKEVYYKWRACKVDKLKYKRGNKVKVVGLPEKFNSCITGANYQKIQRRGR